MRSVLKAMWMLGKRLREKRRDRKDRNMSLLLGCTGGDHRFFLWFATASRFKCSPSSLPLLFILSPLVAVYDVIVPPASGHPSRLAPLTPSKHPAPCPSGRC